MNDKRTERPQGYDEYARQPVRRYTDPMDASPVKELIERWAPDMMEATPELLDQLRTRGYTLEVGKLTREDKAARRSPPVTLILAPRKPHLRLRVKLGASSRMPLWTVTAITDMPTPLSVWRAHCAQAIADATRRARLGL